MTSEDGFKQWLDGKMEGCGMLRRYWAELNEVDLDDLRWAFSAGFTLGESKAVERG